MLRSVLRRTLWGLGSVRPPARRVRHAACRPHVERLEDRTVPSGEPILVVTAQANPFSSYYPEILRAEGLNAFAASDIAAVTPATLAGHDVVILGEMPLTTSQVTMFSDWVTAGGNLVAMRPDKKLAGLLGLTDAASTRDNAYLLANTSSSPGAGIVGETIQYHGTADLYTLNGASSIATLYASATAATANPAVTLRGVGTSGGQAAAFAYDLARSVVYTRQGNPAWSGQNRDGQGPVRSNDLFYGNASFDPQPDWVDLNKVAIPQADEQQRLLANLVLEMNLDNLPLPRFWYLPRGEKAAVVMTGDDHATGGTAGRFDQYLAASPPDSSAADWSAVRGTSYVYPNTPITNAQAAAYAAQGFEIALHVNTGAADWTPAQLDTFYANQLAQFRAAYPNVPTPVTNRTHAIVWSDYATQPKVELKYGIRFDTNYYYFPSEWVQNRPGLFTGSGMPMRFADADGTLIDVYQAATQMTDESGQGYPSTAAALLDAALDARGYYGVFTANMHTDSASSSGSDAIVGAALGRGVPVVSARQMLQWLDARNASSFGALGWDAAQSTLGFAITPGAGASGLEAMVPVRSTAGVLTGLTRDGGAVAYTTEVIKGVAYAFFPGAAGTYAARYGPDTTAPTLTTRTPAPGAAGVPTTDSVTATFGESIRPDTISVVLRDSAGNIVPGSSAYDASTNTVAFTPAAVLKLAASYTVTVSGAKDHAGNAMADQSWSFATTSTVANASIWPSTAVPAVTASDDSGTYELGVKLRSDIDGYITGVRFYKGAGNTGTHVGHLWTASGTLLASATFTNESATGWQQVDFAQPVQVQANTTYVASYFAPNGHYAFDSGYFTSAGVDSGVLHALSDAAGGNGVFLAGATGFPTNSFNAANYWVDVVFSNTLAPAVTARTPTPDAAGVDVGSAITATFNRPLDPATVTNSTFRLRAVGAATDVPATVSYSGLTATLQPTAPLSVNQTYQVTVSGAITGADGTPVGSDSTWSFTTQPILTVTDTTAADFDAGTTSEGTAVVQTGNGEVTLKPAAGSEFSGTALPAGWTSAPWGAGGAATVTGGVLTVDGARAGTAALYTPGRSLEFVATFSGDAFQHAGFADDFNTALWAMFSTGSGGALYARTAGPSGSAETQLVGLLGGSHRFRIDWTATDVKYSVDGVQVAAHNLAVTNSMRPVASDFNVGGGAVGVDWMWLSPPYTPSGTFLSRVLDAGRSATWIDAMWASSVPAETSLALSVRMGNTPTPDGTWTDFIPLANSGATLGQTSRYLQYRAELATTNTEKTPALQAATFQYRPNTAPAASNDSYTTAEDSPLTISAPGVLGNDADADGDSLSPVLVSGPAHGTLALNANGSFTYTPAANYFGPDSFAYKVNDGRTDSNTATVSITVTAVNDAPVAANDAYTTSEDTSLTVNAPGVLGNDTVGDGSLTAVLVSGPSHGTLTLNGNGSFTYTPAANYSGPDSFTYKANDGQADSNTATVSLTVTAVNDAPVAANDSYTTSEDTPLTVAAAGVLGNDTDVDSASLSAVMVSGPSHGTLTLNANGSFTYTPTANYSGTDSFTYEARDGALDSGVATVSLTVTAVNDAPAAAGNSYTTTEDTALTVSAPGVLGNDSDVDSASLTAVLVSGPAHGTLTLNSNGSFTYTPAANYSGSDSFTYRARDGALDSNTATVSITVTAVNDAPVTANDSYTTAEDSPLTISAPGVLGNDADADGDSLSPVLVSGPAHGTLALNANGSFTYTPAANYFGPDSFTYRASDGELNSNTATVFLTVTAVNDAPVAAGNSYSSPEEQTLTVAVASGVLGNDSDIDGDGLTAVLVSGPAHGTLALNANGSFTYTPAAAYSGPDSFTYRARDDTGALSSVSTVALTVTPPTLSINSVAGNEGALLSTPFTFTVTLSSATSRTIAVNYATANGTATAGLPLLVGDYTSASGTLTFTGGQISKTITVQVTGDLLSEPNETFFVNLSGASTPLSDSQGQGTILNDDSLLLVVPKAGDGTSEALTQESLAPIVAEAAARWTAAGMDTAPLDAVEVRIADLPGTALGVTTGDVIWIDANATGWGWFVDPTPGDDGEFSLPGNQGEEGRIDLLTVVAHEMGHALGLEHGDEGVMYEELEPGVRHLPVYAAVTPPATLTPTNLAGKLPAEQSLPAVTPLGVVEASPTGLAAGPLFIAPDLFVGWTPSAATDLPFTTEPEAVAEFADPSGSVPLDRDDDMPALVDDATFSSDSRSSDLLDAFEDLDDRGVFVG